MGDISLVEEAFNRLKSIKNTEGLFVMNNDGIAIRTTMENEETVHYAALVSRFVEKARATVKLFQSDDELQHMRIRSKKHEIVIAPEFNKNNQHTFYLVSIHKPRCT